MNHLAYQSLPCEILPLCLKYDTLCSPLYVWDQNFLVKNYFTIVMFQYFPVQHMLIMQHWYKMNILALEF